MAVPAMTMTDEIGVLVTPLQPPFYGPYEVFEFSDCKPLAVSIGDGQRIRDMLGTNQRQRLVRLEAADDKVRIRIKPVAS